MPSTCPDTPAPLYTDPHKEHPTEFLTNTETEIDKIPRLRTLADAHTCSGSARSAGLAEQLASEFDRNRNLHENEHEEQGIMIEDESYSDTWKPGAYLERRMAVQEAEIEEDNERQWTCWGAEQQCDEKKRKPGPRDEKETQVGQRGEPKSDAEEQKEKGVVEEENTCYRVVKEQEDDGSWKEDKHACEREERMEEEVRRVAREERQRIEHKYREIIMEMRQEVILGLPETCTATADVRHRGTSGGGKRERG
eukprot:49307-Rhodomonas_salina.1